MDEKQKLREQFFAAMMRYKKTETTFSTRCEIPMNELAILNVITGKCSCSDCDSINLDVPDIQEKLQISKPAVSYILNTLEKKAYITREIDAKDRRKISIRATKEGIAAADQCSQRFDEMWTTLLLQFGEADMRHLVELLTGLTNLFETTKCDS